MKIIIHLLLQGLAVFFAAELLPGVRVDGYMSAFLVALALGVLNTFVKPLLQLLALPITLLTLGLFSLVINVLMIMAADWFVAGFQLDGFLQAVIFGILMSIINSLLHQVTKA